MADWKYINRSLEKTILEANKYFSVISLTGPRQSGKSTLIRHLFPQYAEYSLKDLQVRQFAESDPVAFLNQHPEGMFIDEVQKVPALMEYIQGIVDRNPEEYMAIIEKLSGVRQGMTRVELASALRTHDNGRFGDMLEDLVHCDFIRRYNNGGNENGGIYQLVDFFTLCYHLFGKSRTTDDRYWSNMLNDPCQNTFYGLAFERVCMFHFRQVTKALGVSGIHTEFYSWRSRVSEPAVQIDMVIDRADGVVNICEVKYSRLPYVMTGQEADGIEAREAAFVAENPGKQWTQVVLITTKGLKRNVHSGVAKKELTLDELFG